METEPPRKLFTPVSANRLLPAVRERLAKMRALHRALLRLQGQSDIEELTGADPAGALSAKAQARVNDLEPEIEATEMDLENALVEFQGLGCELKDLERGLVDFYALREGKLVFLCWQEGEEKVGFWHPLEGGYAGRQPL